MFVTVKMVPSGEMACYTASIPYGNEGFLCHGFKTSDYNVSPHVYGFRGYSAKFNAISHNVYHVREITLLNSIEIRDARYIMLNPNSDESYTMAGYQGKQHQILTLVNVTTDNYDIWMTGIYLKDKNQGDVEQNIKIENGGGSITLWYMIGQNASRWYIVGNNANK